MSTQQADEILLEVNVYPPSEHMMKTFLKRMLYWLIAKQTPIGDGDVFVISPEGNVRITADTNLIVDFKPSRYDFTTPIRASIKETPFRKEPTFTFS
jgi:hypothetical protein